MNVPTADPAPEADAAVERKKKSKKPKYSRFTQQELPALLTPTIVISTFALIGILFIPIGLGSLSASENVSKNMKAPVHIYYELYNFYQNHRSPVYH